MRERRNQLILTSPAITPRLATVDRRPVSLRWSRFARAGQAAGLIWLFLFLTPFSVWAQRYRFRYYSHRDGLKEPEVTCLLQDRTGFLWVGTSGGLFRYDGVRFNRFGATDHAIDFRPVAALAQTPEGTLWVGTRNGLERVSGDKMEFVNLLGEVRINGSSSMAVDARGSLYVATSRGLYAGHPTNSGFDYQHYPNPSRVADPAAYSVHIDPEGIAWFGCGDSLCNLTPEGIDVFGREAGVLPDRWDAILSDLKGNLWIRSARRLFVRPKGTVLFTPQHHGLAQAKDVGSLYLDSEGQLFVPTESGLSRRIPGGWETINIEKGLPTNPTCCVLEDHEGSIWVGLAGAGMARWIGDDQWESRRTEAICFAKLTQILKSLVDVQVDYPLTTRPHSDRRCRLYRRRSNSQAATDSRKIPTSVPGSTLRLRSATAGL